MIRGRVMDYRVEYWSELRVYMVSEYQGNGRGAIFNERDAVALVRERPGLARAFDAAKAAGRIQKVSGAQTARASITPTVPADDFALAERWSAGWKDESHGRLCGFLSRVRQG